MSSTTISYKDHRFPPQIIAHAVWLYFRLPLSLRLFEEMLLEHGIVVSYETIRRWAGKFRTAYARQLRRKKASQKDIWHLDEVVISIGGRKHWLWRAVDQDGHVLDEIVQPRCRYQGCQAIADQAAEEAGSVAQAHHHRQTALIRRGKSGCDAWRRTSIAQKAEQSLGEFSRTASKARADDAGLPIRGRIATFHPVFSAVRNFFFPPHQKRSALATHIHRIRAIAQWKAVTGATA